MRYFAMGNHNMDIHQLTAPLTRSGARLANTLGTTARLIPFRKSIWVRSRRYHFAGLTPQQFDDLAQIYDVLGAKLNIAFPSFEDALALSHAIDALPSDPADVPAAELQTQLHQFLVLATGLHGIAIRTAICALAVRKDGRYPPMDRKIVAGLVALGVVTADGASDLLGVKSKPFAAAYVRYVVPAWKAEMETRTPSDADIAWASSGVVRGA